MHAKRERFPRGARGVPSKCAADSERASQRTPPLVSLAAQSTTRVSFREKMAANLYTFKYTDDRNPAARRTSIAADAGGPMAVHPGHMLAVALEGELPPCAGATQILTSHMDGRPVSR